MTNPPFKFKTSYLDANLKESPYWRMVRVYPPAAPGGEAMQYQPSIVMKLPSLVEQAPKQLISQEIRMKWMKMIKQQPSQVMPMIIESSPTPLLRKKIDVSIDIGLSWW